MRVVIADDSGLLRDGLANLLTEAGVDVVARAADADQLLAMVDEHTPDIAVVDIRMPPTYTHEGAKAALELRQRQPGLGILLLSQSLESRYVTDLARQHARGFGYLLKDRVTDVKVLLDALDSIAAGGTVLDPEVVSHLLGRNELARAARPALRARARGAGADGAGALEPGDRRTAGHRREDRGDPHRPDPDQAGPAPDARRAPAGAGRARVASWLSHAARD